MAGFRLRPWPYLGGLAVVCVVLQAVTGILLAFSYQPTPDTAYVSVYYITNAMPYGWLVRTVHSWGSHLLIVFAALHAVRMFVTASYKHPRRANWVLGVVALLATIAMSFTGNLLPWDQRAYWDTTRAVALFEQAPLVGEWLVTTLLGGDTIGPTALTRFHASHVTILPALLVGLLFAHLWLARRAAARERSAGPDRPQIGGAPSAMPLYPDLLVSWATTWALLLSLLAVLAILAPVSLDVKADPSLVLEQSKPAWYFLSLYTLERWIPPAVAATVTFLLGVLFIALPYSDRSPSHEPKERMVALGLGFLVIAGVLALTVIGALL
jgi:quinol-cytochrome oxidoreductase complex cytochrome b subunit